MNISKIDTRCAPPPKSIIKVPPGIKPYLSSPNEKTLTKTKYIHFVEDTFGTLYSKCGNPSVVKRYTWKNQNKIEAQVITYGARVTSMKVPGRSGCADDLVFGCDDLAGYLCYENLYMGATIGRTSNWIPGASFAAEGKQFWVVADENGGHYNGGKKGFDKVNWVPFVNGNQLILSYISKDGEQGYPGDLFVRISFELKSSNEFKINIQANCTKITPVDISNLIYFNLAGHEKDESELKKHILLLNSNCYTEYNEDTGFPTGEIVNVVNSRFDFQTPKLLNELLEDGYNQNFCVNRGVDQIEAFVARITHPFSGRVLEVYSNQPGVNFETCVNFGNGLLDIRFPNFDALSVSSETVENHSGIFLLIKKFQEYCVDVLKMPEEEYMEILKTLTQKLLKVAANFGDNSSIKLGSDTCSFHEDFNADFDISILLLPFELQLLHAMLESIPLIDYDMDWLQIRDVIHCIIRKNARLSNFDLQEEVENNEEEVENKEEEVENKDTKPKQDAEKLDVDKSIFQISLNDNTDKSQSDVSKSSRSSKKSKNSIFPIPKNSIPKFYKDGRIHGKDGVIYKMNSGMCLRTQNYPSSVHLKNFPNPLLRPNETYTHSTTYKFWIQSGNPAKWLARMNMENPCLENKNKNG